MGMLRKIWRWTGKTMLEDPYRRLAGELASDEQSAERAARQLCELANDPEEKTKRSAWPETTFVHHIEFFQKVEPAARRDSIQELIATLERERQALLAKAEAAQSRQDPLRARLEELGLSPSPQTLKMIAETIEDDEKIHFLVTRSPGRHTLSRISGYLLTDERIIDFDEAVASEVIALPYRRVVSVTSAPGFVGGKYLDIQTDPKGELRLDTGEQTEEIEAFLAEHVASQPVGVD